MTLTKYILLAIFWITGGLTAFAHCTLAEYNRDKVFYRTTQEYVLLTIAFLCIGIFGWLIALTSPLTSKSLKVIVQGDIPAISAIPALTLFGISIIILFISFIVDMFF